MSNKKKWTDEEIDQLFKAMSDQDHYGGQSAWNSVEKALDDVVKPKAINLKPWIVSLLFLLVSTTTYFYFKQKATPESLKKQSESVANSSKKTEIEKSDSSINYPIGPSETAKAGENPISPNKSGEGNQNIVSHTAIDKSSKRTNNLKNKYIHTSISLESSNTSITQSNEPRKQFLNTNTGRKSETYEMEKQTISARPNVYSESINNEKRNELKSDSPLFPNHETPVIKSKFKPQKSKENGVAFQSKHLLSNNGVEYTATSDLDSKTSSIQREDVQTYASRSEFSKLEIDRLEQKTFSNEKISFTFSEKIKVPQIPEKSMTQDPIVKFWPKPGLSLKLGYSPDLSTVNKVSLDQWGSNYLVGLNYRINQRWSVSTGYIRSVKYYSASPEDYVWPWANTYSPMKQINAICRMVDIPVNFRYDFKTKVSSRFFVSSGLTSYYMKNETYNYIYINDKDPAIKNRSWGGKTGFYPVGVLNLSAGIEKKIGKRASILFEPFSKVPITQVGFFKIKLSSFGFMGSVLVPLSKKID
jgi:hypothetical protein